MSDPWDTAILADAALLYSKLGWYVFPCVPGGKRPLTSHGFKDATRDPKTIRDWWAAHPLANIGVDCGRSKIAVVDLDVKAGADGPGTWDDLKIQYNVDDSQALEQETPSGGIHKIFKATQPIKNTAGQLGQGIDTRGDGGYIVVAPSRTDQGSYIWEASSHPADCQAGPWPAELLPLLANGHKSAQDPWEQADTTEQSDHFTEGERNVRLTSMAGRLRRSGLDAKEMLPSLLAYNQQHSSPPLDPQEVEAIAESVGRYPPGAVPATEAPAGSPTESVLTRADASDEGNARCVVALYPNEFLWVEAFGWMGHHKTHWARELAEARLDRAIVDTLQRRRLAAVEADREGIVKTTRATATNVRNAKYLVQSLIPAHVADFDSFPNLLNCKNGVLDLRTGRLVGHQPGQRFTYCLPIEYDPEADYTEWKALLLEWTGGEAQVVDFLQAAIGYTLTGHTSEECLFYLHGPTRSGKGTFAETLLAMMGKEPLATGVDFSTFTMDRSHDSQNFDLAGLKPCRLVMASESSKYSSLNAARVKSLTGGDEVRCAFKRKDHFTYRPQFKVWLLSNYPPKADVDDDAIWYRLKTINFPNTYEGREDKTLKARLRQPESLQGILTWATIGAVRWANNPGTGLRIPQQIKDATNQARRDLDYVAEWIEECLEIVDPATGNPQNHFVSNSAIYLSYSNWCKENGVEPKHKRSLSMELKRKGLDAGQQKKVNGIKYRGCFGIKIS